MSPARRALITERSVRAAAKAGQRSIDARGAAITPSARDAAQALGVLLDHGSGVGRAAQGPRPDLQGVGAEARGAGREATGAPTAPHSAPSPAPRRIALGADHGGVAMKDAILAALRDKGHMVDDLGTFGPDAVDYPDFAVAVARAVADGRAELGIMIDGAGIGSCMAANKVAGVRAAMCYDVTTAANAREHNDANVLALGSRVVNPGSARAVVRVFLATAHAGGRHARRVAKINAIEQQQAAQAARGRA